MPPISQSKLPYKILLTSLFHDRTENISYKDIEIAMTQVDKVKLFPFLLVRMETYFKECETGTMISLLGKAVNGSCSSSVVLGSSSGSTHQTTVSTSASNTDHHEDQNSTKIKFFSNFIKFLYEAIGQSLKCVKTHYNKLEDGKYSKLLEDKFHNLLNNLLEKFDYQSTSLKDVESKKSPGLVSLFTKENNYNLKLDKDTKHRIFKMNIEPIIISKYKILAKLYDIIEENSFDVSTCVVPLIQNVLNESIPQNDFNHANIPKTTIQNLAQLKLTKTRIKNMFMYIQSYPECMDSLDELGLLVDKFSCWEVLFSATRDIISDRLCAPHAATSDLITCYMHAVQVLGRLESGTSSQGSSSVNDISNCQLLRSLAPLENYLKSRSDTVPEIVKAMLSSDIKNNILAQEMQQVNNHKILTEEEIFENCLNWKPSKPSQDYYNSLRGGPRVDDFWSGRCRYGGGVGHQTKGNGSNGSKYSKKPNDLLSLMLSVYGSTEKFIKSYQKLLIERLINIFQNLDGRKGTGTGSQKAISLSNNEAFMSERKNLELLQSRFENDNRGVLLDYCRVMFRDFEDSVKFLNSGRKQPEPEQLAEAQNFKFNTLLISDQSWNNNKEFSIPAFSKIKVNSEIEQQMSKFNQDFKKVKGSRYVDYFKSKGFSEIEIDFEDGSEPLTIECDQICLSVLDVFAETKQTNPNFTIQEISNLSNIPKNHLTKYLQFWKQHFVIAETKSNDDLIYGLATDAYSRACREKLGKVLKARKSSQQEKDNSDENMSDEADAVGTNEAVEASSKGDTAAAVDDFQINDLHLGLGYGDMGLAFGMDLNGSLGPVSSSSKANQNKNKNSDLESRVPEEPWTKPFHQYWKYIQNSIKAAPKKCLTLEQIHKKLAIFSKMEPDSDEDEEEGVDLSFLGDRKKLKVFLGRKVKVGEIGVVEDDCYVLR